MQAKLKYMWRRNIDHIIILLHHQILQCHPEKNSCQFSIDYNLHLYLQFSLNCGIQRSFLGLTIASFMNKGL